MTHPQDTIYHCKPKEANYKAVLSAINKQPYGVDVNESQDDAWMIIDDQTPLKTDKKSELNALGSKAFPSYFYLYAVDPANMNHTEGKALNRSRGKSGEAWRPII